MPKAFDRAVFRQTLAQFFAQLKVTYIDDWKPELLEVVTPLEHSNVVKLDLIIGDAIKAFLLANSPFPVYTEETIEPGTLPTADLFWLVDPIDGTREFVKRIPESVSSIALVEHGTGLTVFGAIYDLFGGVFHDTDTYTPKRTPVVRPQTLLFSRSEAAKGWGPQLAASNDLFLPVVPMGSIAHKLLKVALAPDRFAVVSLAPKSLWDVAGSIGFGQKCPWIKMTDLEGVPLDVQGKLDRRLSGVIGAHTDIFDDILARIRKLRG